MKRTACIAIVAFLLASTMSVAQNSKAIGLRIGGGNDVGAEISYQAPFMQNRGELDLGFGGNSNWNYWKLTGLYQWVMPLDGRFKWYLGLGPSLGNWSYVGKYPNDYNSGITLALALNAGVHYTFTEAPIQISLDTRPELGIINRRSNSWFGLALGVRYVFK
jgi:hypothetical protein